jgi:molybdenum cofactor cytidylyltransferase
MSSSIRTGIQALQKLHIDGACTHIDGALILLGDQPLITSHMLNTLIKRHERTHKRIITSLYNGKRSSPTLFDRSLFPELLEITGDEGGRAVIERHREEIARVEHGDETASYDVDTWDAYEQVVAIWNNRQQKGTLRE